MYQQFGKPSGPLLKQKTSFFEQNNLHVDKQNQISEIYKRQPLRERCKNCDHPLPSTPDFEKLGINYVYCRTCTHLNGCHEDTAEYCEKVYTGAGGDNYGANYSSKTIADYKYRQASIYAPKAEFLFSAGHCLYGTGTRLLTRSLVSRRSQ